MKFMTITDDLIDSNEELMSSLIIDDNEEGQETSSPDIANNEK